MRLLLTLIICLTLFGCSGQKGQDSQITGTSYNYYIAQNPAEFKAALFSWAEKNNFKVIQSSSIKIEKEYAPNCVVSIWADGDPKGEFKLCQSMNFKGEKKVIFAANQDYNVESSSLFDAVKAYYTPPQ